jgi:Protein of unknown function (DUF2946)
VRKFGSWLAVFALALQASWPLLVAAKPRAVALVPLCTVEGVTHYLEVPTGDAPAGTQHEHCSFCFLGGAAAASHQRLPAPADSYAEELAPAETPVVPQPFFTSEDARAPPLPVFSPFSQ